MLSALLKPIHTKEKTQVLDAINTLRFKVTPENIALTTSLPLATASQQLNIIAAETAAHLKVDSSGALLYEFSPGFERAYLYDITKQLFSTNGNFFFRALRVIFRLAVGLTVLAVKLTLVAMNFLFRVMFGVLLIASIALVIFAVIAAIAAIFNDNGGGGDLSFGDAGGGLGDLASGIGNIHIPVGDITYDFIRLLDWSYYWSDPCYGSSCGYSYDYYYSSKNSTPKTLTQLQHGPKEQEKKGDFVTNCFSYLFGDGDPNADLKERYWHQIGLVIKRNHGVVVAEQIAPYAGDSSGTEDWMLPILVHFNGSPEVTDKGNILYVFPSFVREDNISEQPLSLKPQTNPGGSDPLRDLYRSHLKRQADQSWQGVAANTPTQLSRFLEERRWVFSLQGAGSTTKIACLAFLNLIGCYWLYAASFFTKPLQAFHHVSIFMLGYAVFLIAFPFLRAIWISFLNLGIDSRNEKRAAFAAAIGAPTSAVKDKLNEASAHINHLLLAPQPSIVFTTEEDSLEQQFAALPKFDASRNYIS